MWQRRQRRNVNASLQGLSADAHRHNLEVLASTGAQSPYHLANGAVDAHREPPTLRMVGPGKTPYHYHFDLEFASRRLAGQGRSGEIETLEE